MPYPYPSLSTPHAPIRIRHRQETRRGLNDSEDLLVPGDFQVTLAAGETVTIVISTESVPSADFDSAWARHKQRSQALLTGTDSPPTCNRERQLVLAADQFIVTRESTEALSGRTVIAGYPWFGDWGRDTMIALPGLTLATGRFDDARDILHTFAEVVDRGMLPNRFPDDGAEPEYNTVDATLWFIQAAYAYTEAS